MALPPDILGIGQRAHWCFTLFSFEDSLEELGLRLSRHSQFRYYVAQLEKCPRTGSPHYQGYIEFKRSVRHAVVKDLIGGSPHVSARLGSRDEARDYCMKEDTRHPLGDLGIGINSGPIEVGLWHESIQGKRTDISSAAGDLLEHRSLKRLATDHPGTYVKFSRGFKALLKITAPVRDRQILPTITLYYGHPGMGKSRKAWDLYEDSLGAPSDGFEWFDDYNGEKTLLLDDFCGSRSKMTLDRLLKITDRYHVSLRQKGDFTPLLAHNLVITTNIHPRLWYDWLHREVQYKSMYRRFTGVLYFPEFGPDGLASKGPVALDMKPFFEDYAEYCDEVTSWPVCYTPELITSSPEPLQPEPQGSPDLEFLEVDTL